MAYSAVHRRNVQTLFYGGTNAQLKTQKIGKLLLYKIFHANVKKEKKKKRKKEKRNS
jgi:hypothetical protein